MALSGAHELGAPSAWEWTIPAYPGCLAVKLSLTSSRPPFPHELLAYCERRFAPDPAFLAGFRQDRTTPMTANPNSFQNEYFLAVINGNRNLFNSDRVLWGNHARSNAAVQLFANDRAAFFTAFAKAS